MKPWGERFMPPQCKGQTPGSNPRAKFQATKQLRKPSITRSSSREVRIKGTNFFLWSILEGEPSPKKGKRALLGDLDQVRGEKQKNQPRDTLALLHVKEHQNPGESEDRSQ